MLRSLFLWIGICASVFLRVDIPPEFHKVTAQKGDGIYSLLRRFALDQHSCNFDQFYSLNRLTKNSPLIAGKEYILPIYLYRFNGKTIRSSIGIDDWDLAVRIQQYNEKMLENSVRTESFKKDHILWVPYHEVNCPKPDLNIPPPSDLVENDNGTTNSSGDRNFPIFGKKLAYTPLKSSTLRGKVFYVVSGHGGPDPGAIGRRSDRSLCEDEYAYDVALRLCRKLIEHGATAYMITRDPDDGIRSGSFLQCDNDEMLWGDIPMSTDLKTRLFQRSDIINELYEKNRQLGVTDQKVIVIHVDSRNRSERIDLFFYYQQHSQESLKIANRLQETMREKYKIYRKNGAYHGSVTARDLHMLREVKAPTVYIELANIRNSTDQQRIILESNRQYLADWLFDGLK